MINRLTSCLYYPFSRCMNPSSLKQMLLVFDEVNFLDPVDDESWRAKLFDDMATNDDHRFREFDHLKDHFPILIDEKAVVRLDPDKLKFRINSQEAAAAAISDLADSSWTKTASNPAAYGLPFRPNDAGTATWQMFRPKIPDVFLEAAANSKALTEHIYEDGGSYYAWSLSYAAGSALAINGHLAVAEELGLAPITDSVLHQTLLERKAHRHAKNNRDAKYELEKIDATQIATDIVMSLVPDSKLASLSFEDILRFRSETAQLRKELLPEILIEIQRSKLNLDATAQNYKKRLQLYRTELAATRDRLWPNLIPSGKGLAVIGGATTASTIAASVVGSPGMVMLSSIVPTALACLKQVLDYKASRNKIENSASPGIAYLSKIERQLG
jgi:hypothetical protein